MHFLITILILSKKLKLEHAGVNTNWCVRLQTNNALIGSGDPSYRSMGRGSAVSFTCDSAVAVPATGLPLVTQPLLPIALKCADECHAWYAAQPPQT